MKATTFGQRLKQLRGKRSINEVARMAGISPIGVSRLERDLTEPELRTAHDLALALGVSLGEFDGVSWPEKIPRKRAKSG